MKKNISRRSFVHQLSLATAAVMANPFDLYSCAPAGQKKLGVALVGLGGYSTGQLGPALKETKFCHLTGVVTGSPDKGARWAKEYGFPEKNIYSYEQMHEISGNPDIDIIYVVTPNGLHAKHAIAAAEAGKHVLCEKPMANTVAECDQIIAACKKAGVRLSMGYRLHFDPYHGELRRLAREKDFGEFTSTEGGFSFVMNRKVWRADKKLAGGGPLMDLGIYVIQANLMASNGIMPVSIEAKEHPKTRPDIFTDVEETISWTMEFPNKSVGRAETSYQKNHNRFRAEGKTGWIDFSQGALSYRVGKVETSRGSLSYPAPFQQALQMDDFAQCILSNKESRVPGEMGRRDLVIIEAIYRSAAEGKKIAISQ